MRIGLKIRNENNSENFFGTLCCFVTDYINNFPNVALTCFHAVHPQYQNWNGQNFSSNTRTLVYDNNQWQYLGEIYKAYRSELFDIALIRLPENSNYINHVPYCGIAQYTEFNTPRKNQSIKMWGGNTERLNLGIITELDRSPAIQYLNQEHDSYEYHTLHDLFFIQSSEEEKPFGIEGDSGSLIIDNENNAIAMFIANSGDYGWAIPIQSLLSRNGLILKSNY